MSPALEAFHAHFGRPPLEGNAHDAGCLRQIELFRVRHGRWPDTSTRGDLQALQQIELDTLGSQADQLGDRIAPPTPAPRDFHKELDELERAMMKLPAPDRGLRHTFTPGLYIRELSTPAGTLSISKIHKTEHPWNLSKGRITIWTQDGPQEFTAPASGVTPVGARRAIFYHRDSVLTTYHPTAGLGLTDEQDLAQKLAAIEAAIIEPHTEHLAGLTQPAPETSQ